MIWINLIKNYLSALAVKDIYSINEFLDDSIKQESIKIIIDKLSIIDDISIKILNIAYNNKLFFVEYEMQYKYIDFTKYKEYKKFVDVIEIGYSGKIVSIKNYHR